jgi:hypothetical protein
MEGRKLHPRSSGQGHVAGPFEQGNKHRGYIKRKGFIDYLRSWKDVLNEFAMISEESSSIHSFKQILIFSLCFNRTFSHNTNKSPTQCTILR